MSAIFEYTKLNLERTIQNLKSKKFEFIYEDTETFVPENKTYSIYYLLDKRELYFTNIITSKYVRKMIRLFPSVYSQYTNIKTIDRENYPSNITPDITEKDYNTGSITRYFVQKANNINASVYETSESDFNKNLTLYNKTSFSWVILGIKEDVIRQNTITIENQEQNYKGISKMLFPLQYWRPSKDVPVTLEKKLSLLKTN
jgi:hypothetical protein